MTAPARSRLPDPRVRAPLAVLLVAGPVLAVCVLLVISAVDGRRVESFEKSAVGETRSVVMLIPDDLRGPEADDVGASLRTSGRLEAVIVDADGRVSRSSSAVDISDVPERLQLADGRSIPTGTTEVAGSSYLVAKGAKQTTAPVVYLFFSQDRLREDSRRTALVVVSVAAALLIAVVAGGWWSSHARLRDLAARRRREEAFTAHLAHELRTPVGALVTAASLVDAPRLRESPEGLRGPVEAMQSEARRLRRVVEDLLEISRLETGQVRSRPEHVELMGLIRAVVDGYGWRTVSTAGPVEVVVYADEQSLVRVVANLLSNAVEHGETVAVEVSTTGSGVVLAVTDDGPGMSAADVERLTGRTVPGSGAARDLRAARGFGLTIAREHARLLGATVDVVTAAGRGTTVRVSVPDGIATG